MQGKQLGAEYSSEWLLILIKTFACLFLLMILIYKRKKEDNKNTIPGPWNLPIIGSLHHLGLNPHLSFQKLKEKYGNMFKVKVGSQEMVVVCGLDLIQEAMIEKATVFAGRPALFTFQFLSEGKSLSFNTYNETFKIHRQKAERALQKFINDEDFVNTVVYKEANILVEQFLDLKEKPVYPVDYILWAVGHVKYKMCFGDSRGESEDFQTVISNVIKFMGTHNSGSVLNFFPWTRRLLSWKRKHIESLCNTICGLTKRKELEHIATFQPYQMRNVLDGLIATCHEMKNSEQTRIIHTTNDFIGAGLDIIYVTLSWALLYLAQYPDIQTKLKMEIKTVIGCRGPKKEDSISMPYTQAFIFEVMRHSCVVPFALPHANIEDTTLGSFDLCKDTFLMISLYSVHKDEKLWPNPEEFNPSRFLNSAGVLNQAALDKFIPFGIGKRKCLGKQFAKQEVFMFLCTLLQSCIVRKPVHVDRYDLKPVFGVTLKPKPFQVVFVKDCRNKS